MLMDQQQPAAAAPLATPPEEVQPAPAPTVAEAPMATPPPVESTSVPTPPPADVPVAEPPQDPLETVVSQQANVPRTGTMSGNKASVLVIGAAVISFVALCVVAVVAYAQS